MNHVNQPVSRSAVVVGAQWGDEGKGKITDFLTSKYNVVVRFQGGHNAGHTVWVDGRKSVTHLIPSGVLRDGVMSVIGHGVVVDPRQFKKEVENLRSLGLKIDASNLMVSLQAPVITAYHQALDHARETKSSQRIGTTGRGIGPAYEDKTSRRGIRVSDLFDRDVLTKRLERSASEKNALLKHYGVAQIDLAEEVQQLYDFGQFLKPFAGDAYSYLHQAESGGKKILFEGAQGLLLDLDYGTYPFVTSSFTHGLYASIGAGGALPQYRFGVVKSYITRVGEGPMPTEIGGPLEEHLRQLGGEFGATTGRARRCGWLDLPLLRYSIRFSGLTGLILTKSDVLAQLDEVYICQEYEFEGHAVQEAFPGMDLQNARPKLLKLGALKSKEQIEDYIGLIEKSVGIPVVIHSFGVDRNALDVRRPDFFSG